jgi:hypothetical protein
MNETETKEIEKKIDINSKDSEKNEKNNKVEEFIVIKLSKMTNAVILFKYDEYSYCMVDTGCESCFPEIEKIKRKKN